MPRTMTRVHPRMGREKTMYFEDKYFCRGSPPRRRGKEAQDRAFAAARRITPAWAGKSIPAGQDTAEPQDHPRVGGEKLMPPLMGFWLRGSPPHGRGKVDGGFLGGCGLGITPAWAGKSIVDCLPVRLIWDHPRVSGEKSMAVFWAAVVLGSPPRGRGKAL